MNSKQIKADTNVPWLRFDPQRVGFRLGLGRVLGVPGASLLSHLARSVGEVQADCFLGAAWAVIQPFFSMVVFSIFFGKLAKMPSDGVPYPVWSFAALLPWQYFSNALSNASTSVVGNANLIKKVYFPRLVVPVSGVLSGVSGLRHSLRHFDHHDGVLWGKPEVWPLFLLPAFLLLALVTALGVSLWISALNVKYRDFSYIVPFLTQFWMFATPVVYPSSLLSEPWRTVYGLNPMVGVIEGFRWALLGTSPPGPMLAVSAVVA